MENKFFGIDYGDVTVALRLKRQHGTYAAALYLNKMGYSLTEALRLLCNTRPRT